MLKNNFKKELNQIRNFQIKHSFMVIEIKSDGKET